MPGAQNQILRILYSRSRVMDKNHREKGFQADDSASTGMSDDDASVCSIDPSFDSRDYRLCSEMLEEHLKYNIVAKNFQTTKKGRYSFVSEDLAIDVRVRPERKKFCIEFSCIVYKVDEKGTDNGGRDRPSPYSLMTKMMKYKTMLSHSDKKEQLGRCGESFVLVRSLPTSMFPKEHFIEFGNELDDFIMKAHHIHVGFETKNRITKPVNMPRERTALREDR